MILTVSHIMKRFQNPVLEDVSFSVRKGEFLVLFGPNGCGKTTLLHIIAGVMQPDSGSVRCPKKIGFVFQNYRDALFPWKTNLENIAFPLELQRVPKQERLRKATKLVEKLTLSVPLNQYPYQSSGGEQQLVSLLRELLSKPDLLLMDEPFSALHHESRAYLRNTVQDLARKLKLTVVFVTHDITEAVQLGDRVVLLNSKKEVRVTLSRAERVVHSKAFQRMRKKFEAHL
ncbi:MAG: ATP-binding cassette domain-containing protein [Candidatus Woesearchaeota archaeon]|nr:ATP-binding cassette domain-containing protein [Candidatus Woesearchaeota archaeon]